MGGRIGVGGIEEFLNAEEDLLNGDGGFPAFFFVEDRETDGSGGVDIGVEEGWCEFACSLVSSRPIARYKSEFAYTLEAWLDTLEIVC